MLNNTLVTNEVKNSAGTEIEFSRISTVGRSTLFAKANEVPSLPHRLTVSHQENGTGFKLRRRSLVRFDLTVISSVDNVTPVQISAYAVLDAPVGALASNAELKNVMANLNSFLSTTGAATTVLLDGTGNGTLALVNGEL